MRSPFQHWTHQQYPSVLIMHVPVPQQRVSCMTGSQWVSGGEDRCAAVHLCQL